MKFNFDHLGIGISGLCLIHCFLFPILLLFLPALGSFFVEDKTHLILFFLVAASAVVSFLPGYRFHRQIRPLMLACSGFLILGLATFFVHGWFGHFWEPPVAIIGSALLIAAHCSNHRNKHQCAKCDHHPNLPSSQISASQPSPVPEIWEVCWSNSEEEYLEQGWQTVFTGSESEARLEFGCQSLCLQEKQAICLRSNSQVRKTLLYSPKTS